MAEEKKEIDKWLDAVTRMIELTQQGKLKWEAENSLVAPDDERMSAVFTTRYKDKLIRLYAMRVKKYPDDSVAVIYNGLFEKGTNWKKQVILEFVTPNGFALWTFPEVNALHDLLKAVQYQVAGVNDFLEDIFDEADAIAS